MTFKFYDMNWDLYCEKDRLGLRNSFNIGNDTDTMATIVGAVLGAKNGVHAFPEELVRKLDEANGYDLCALAETMEATDVVIG